MHTVWPSFSDLLSHLWQSRHSVVMQAGQFRMASLLGKPWVCPDCDRKAAAGRFLLLYLNTKTRGRMTTGEGKPLAPSKLRVALWASYSLLLASTQAWSLSSSSGSYSSSSFVCMTLCLCLRLVEMPAKKDSRLRFNIMTKPDVFWCYWWQ